MADLECLEGGISGERVGPEAQKNRLPENLDEVLGFLEKAERKGDELDRGEVAENISEVVVALRENSLIRAFIEKWNSLSYREQRKAVKADQNVVSRLFQSVEMKPGMMVPGLSLDNIKTSFLKFMLYYGMIEFKHEGTEKEHEDLIKELHLNDQKFTEWAKLLIKGVGMIAPEAKPLVKILEKLERLMESHGDVAIEVRAAVRGKIRKLLAEQDTDSDENLPLAA